MARKDKGVVTGDPVTYQIPDPAGGAKLETFIPWTLVKRWGKREVVTPLNAPESSRWPRSSAKNVCMQKIQRLYERSGWHITIRAFDECFLSPQPN